MVLHCTNSSIKHQVGGFVEIPPLKNVGTERVNQRKRYLDR